MEMCILVLPKEEFYCSIAVCVCVCVRARVHVLCSVQSCLTLNSSRDCNPPGSSVHESLQTRILEWVAMVFSRGSSQPRDQTQVSPIARGGRYFLENEPNPVALLQTLSCKTCQLTGRLLVFQERR